MTQANVSLHAVLHLLRGERVESILTWMLAHQPRNAHNLLCQEFGINAYRVGDSCFASTAPACDQDKFFVSWPLDMGFDELGPTIPLAETEEQAYALAVDKLSLKDRFIREVLANLEDAACL